MPADQKKPLIKVETKGWSNNFVVAMENIKINSVLYQSREFLIFPTPNYQTVQIAENAHILDHVFAHLNHHCTPNTFIDVSDLTLVAARDIQKGEQLTFAYFTTEVRLDKPFTCQCASSHCLGTVVGAYQIPKKLLQQYPLSQHVQRIIA